MRRFAVLRFQETDRGASLGVDDRLPGIRCPRCKWRPRKRDRWQCRCHHVWNTFDTHGLCPACHYQWRETACLACLVMSPHEDWYASEPT